MKLRMCWERKRQDPAVGHRAIGTMGESEDSIATQGLFEWQLRTGRTAHLLQCWHHLWFEKRQTVPTHDCSPLPEGRCDRGGWALPTLAACTISLWPTPCSGSPVLSTFLLFSLIHEKCPNCQTHVFECVYPFPSTSFTVLHVIRHLNGMGSRTHHGYPNLQMCKCHTE